MPVYDFECTSCGNIFERICSHTEGVQPCKVCGAEAKRKVSAPRHIEGGFYNYEERQDTRKRIEKLERLSSQTLGGGR